MGLENTLKPNCDLEKINKLLLDTDTHSNLLEYELENTRLLLEDIMDDMGREWSATDRKIHIIHDCIIDALKHYKAADDKMETLRDIARAATASTEIEITRL